MSPCHLYEGGYPYVETASCSPRHELATSCNDTIIWELRLVPRHTRYYTEFSIKWMNEPPNNKLYLITPGENRLGIMLRISSKKLFQNLPIDDNSGVRPTCGLTSANQRKSTRAQFRQIESKAADYPEMKSRHRFQRLGRLWRPEDHAPQITRQLTRRKAEPGDADRSKDSLGNSDQLLPEDWHLHFGRDYDETFHANTI